MGTRSGCAAEVARVAVRQPVRRDLPRGRDIHGGDDAVSSLFTFPDPVNEKAVRVTAGGVALLAAAAVVTQRPELLAVIAYGFLARVFAGPTLSPLAQSATRIVAPRLAPPRRVPAPPKRFAQALGAV